MPTTVAVRHVDAAVSEYAICVENQKTGTLLATFRR